MNAYFIYGTLTFSDVLEVLLNKKFEMKKAKVAGYAAFLLNGKNYPGLIPDPSSEIEGYLIHLNQEQEKIIDLFEADFYEKKNLLVDLNNQKVECNAYLIPEKHFKLLSNKPWDPQEFREKHLASYIDMCRDFRNNEIPSLVANTL